MSPVGPIMFGLELGTDGHLTFDQFKLFYADLSSSASVTNFFGSATGGGFLKVATDALSQGGRFDFRPDHDSKIQYRRRRSTDTNTKISDKQAQVDALNERLLTQMSAADAAIAAMEQQYSYLYSMFSAMDTANKSYQ